jgi:hypothetical protein
MYKFTKIACFALFAVLASCATYNMQVNNAKVVQTNTTNKTLSHSFYLVGDAGYNKDIKDKNQVLVALKNKLKEAQENSSVIFLGDNIYPSGLPKKTPQVTLLALLYFKIK